ncbi:MAG: DUF5606 domain-containing protein [Tenuifilum sp.]|uniref:DUF5606 family protein n=1 Tax=Tenuifilum sp. TaxID=2760880 RepID=UPI001B652530|nr:DUF5606 domain-containing protein [Bacteroidales bacterium]HOK61513.1 DUF5606 domain-containing protein [Tenuifilum sp.]MBP9028316.1 DUF5606 domain-containing protein [Bacteroidales bacterium]HOK85184.1 DUF5606 domain-containing protein [Tenuifilum sp.]HON71073.1 DUF5606 domain-containing protein [Tenuifilum sp.]
MEVKLKELLAISGYSGLFRFISQGRQGVIVESLTDGKRTLIPASARVSAIADIAVFTQTEEIPLKDVLKKIEVLENGGPAINNKSADKEIRSYFEKVLPEFDRDRVYTSDIKKIIGWYNLLQSKELLEVLNQTDEGVKPEGEK